MPKRLTIEEVEARCPDMVRGQKWTGGHVNYWFVCEEHGQYLQDFNNHSQGHGCPKCASTLKAKNLGKYKSAGYGAGANNPNWRHGHSSASGVSPTYSSWYAMMRRCYEPTFNHYPSYGGANPPVTVCKRWHSFPSYFEDVGERPENRL